MSPLALHLAGDCGPGCEPCQREEDHAASMDPCPVCGLGFDAGSFALRHTGPGPAFADLHAECCGQCDEGQALRRPAFDRRRLVSLTGAVLP